MAVVWVFDIEAGFGGLTAAIENHRHGHSVSIYESFPVLKSMGDIISFGPNAGRIFSRWGSNGSVLKQMFPLSIDLRTHGFRIHKYTGEHVITQPSLPRDPQAPSINGHRGELHKVVFDHVKDDLKIPIHLGSRVVGYFEDETRAGIRLENGEEVEGDVVIAADGVRSRARELVLGYHDKPQSSGYAIFRAWFPNTEMIADPKTKHLCENGDTFNGWIGPDVHLLVSSIKGGKDISWVLTHKDDHDIAESWSFPGKLDDVYRVLDGWAPITKAIVSKTPENCLFDWKLMYREVLPTWTSPGGRIALLGDAAHPFLPTSIQGATQSMEDGVTIATCLKRAGKANVPGALRAYERIRYERVKAVQKTGETTRNMWHKADWDKVAQNPESIQLPREDWIFKHDAEAHAESVFDQVLREIEVSAPKSQQ